MLKTLARDALPMSVRLRRHPLTPQLKPERLQVYLETVAEATGPVLEVGCFRGATTVAACKHMRHLGNVQPYTIVDTFGGFVAEQFDHDAGLGTPEDFRAGFASNPVQLVERTMRHYDLDDTVTVVQGDILTVPLERLPTGVSVCLMDVDLAVPIHEGLHRVMPLMASGSIVLVDDCDEVTDWKGARVGYRRYCEDAGLPEEYIAGFGVVRT